MADLTEHMSAGDYLLMQKGATGARGKPRLLGCGPAGAGKPVNTNKYGAVRTRLGDEVFDSAKEARTFQELTLAMQAKDPSERVVVLERSRKYLLVPAQEGERACRYIADFVVTYGDGRTDVIDTKSTITRRNPLYVLKRKLMLDRHGIRIREL